MIQLEDLQKIRQIIQEENEIFIQKVLNGIKIELIEKVTGDYWGSSLLYLIGKYYNHTFLRIRIGSTTNEGKVEFLLTRRVSSEGEI